MRTFKIKSFPKKSGFTLMEVIIVIIIAGILASVAIPRYSGAIEKSRAAEGAYILGTLLGAQERYNLENSSYADDPALLDVTIPTPRNFNDPSVSSNCCNTDDTVCASIVRGGALYTLSIQCDGDIVCLNAEVGACGSAGY
ncbi:MAG: prepilin-type N-terminal cleavage/methylation domain-containing protein [Candidatus Aceula meridiana]|nr:prepilin-type N-terminal cleavage/methylation domain-containing protein [Candidatus Aceula meridiana]